MLGIGRSPEQPAQFTHEVTVRRVQRPAPLTSYLAAALSRGPFRYQQADVTDPAALAKVFAAFQPDCVVHLAATRREETAEKLIQGNVLGLCNLVEAYANSPSPVKRIVLGSSGAVYGTPRAGSLPLRESELCTPADAYGASKLAGEHFARVLCERHGIELVIARIFNVVGPAQEERHVCGRIASELASMLQEERPRTISLGGLSATRDYIDVRDVACALRLQTESGVAGETYNLASGVESSVREIFSLLCNSVGLQGQVTIPELPGSGIPRHFACVEKLHGLGFRRRFELPESLRNVIDYYLTFPHGSGPSTPAIHQRAKPTPEAVSVP